jgi:hypothetical protein
MEAKAKLKGPYCYRKKKTFLCDFILNVDTSLIFVVVVWYMIVKCGVLF